MPFFNEEVTTSSYCFAMISKLVWFFSTTLISCVKSWQILYCLTYQGTEVDVERRAGDVETVLRLCEV